MKTIRHSFTLLLAITSETWTQPVSNVGSYPSYASFECAGSRPLLPTLSGSPTNCAQALLGSLPSNIDVGQFHQGGLNDIFRLPATATSGDCQVTVDLTRGTPFQASWPYIHTMAHELITSCTYFRRQAPPSWVTGGSLHLGPGNELSITMSRPVLAANGTQVSTG